MGVRFTNNTKDVIDALHKQRRAAMHAVGVESVGMVVEQMRSGYQTPHATRDQRGRPIEDATHTDIRWRGQLMGSINWQAIDSSTIQVGTNVEYAPFIHEGTSKLESRPFLRDALINNSANKGRMKDIIEDYLSD